LIAGDLDWFAGEDAGVDVGYFQSRLAGEDLKPLQRSPKTELHNGSPYGFRCNGGFADPPPFTT
jgi:hypothetical protein